MSTFDWREHLKQEEWEEGKVVTIADASYRTRVVATCYAAGRQKAVFKNGEHSYGAYVELTRPDGSWIKQGTNIVPVLPDGRLIMVVEQRPPQGRFDQPDHILVNGEKVGLSQFGQYSSLEFPGGAVDGGQTFTAGFIRELQEETEVEDQEAILYERVRPVFPQGSDLALEVFLGMIRLTGRRFSGFVKSDGGLHVLALSPEEVQKNIWLGNIRSGQAAILGWGFYQEIKRLTQDDLVSMVDAGYLNIKKVQLKK